MQVVEQIWLFFQNQILGMQWLNESIGALLSMFGLDLTSKVGASVQFFLYDTIKIVLLLAFLIYLISYIQSYFPPERTKQILARFSGIRANIMGALLGTITPFCSCSSIPLFMGFTGAGVPLGVTFSFLISSPLVDLGAFILLLSIFGWKIALAYVIVGLVLAVVGGTLIEKLGMHDQVADFITHAKQGAMLQIESLTQKQRRTFAWEQVVETVKKVFPYILVGVGIGALIHNWIPQVWIESVLGADNPFSVILATLVGVPMYADIFGTIPVAEALFAKGVEVGTILSFMMAVTALSLPSMIMLQKAIKPKLMITFVSIVTVGIIIIGYAFNAMQFLF
ncbi:MAG: permease [Erysipelotrichaceae bacterium]